MVVIGGGAAGFFAAIRCASLNPSGTVRLLEGTRRPLTKVKISGGGRCNVTHNAFDIDVLVQNYPRGSVELRQLFQRFQPRDTVRWFAEHGVRLKAEADGRMFPVSDTSQTIIDCLLHTADQYRVQVSLGALVTKVQVDAATGAPGFTISLQDGQVLQAQRLLLATGSALPGYALARALGHSISELVPSLFTFNIADPSLHTLAGVAFTRVVLQLHCKNGPPPFSQVGPMLITHWGLSGPAVLKLSAFAAVPLQQAQYQAELRINFLPEWTGDRVLHECMRFKEQQHRQTVLRHPPEIFRLPRRFWERLVLKIGLSASTTWAEAGKKHLAKLTAELVDGVYEISGKGVFKEEFVTCGGVARHEIDFSTMASRICPGLYVAGELLDIDGITGGFNFQNAWTTGWVAGTHMADV